MADDSDEARRALLRQLVQLRKRIDPRTLDRVLSRMDGWEPYDRESAGEAVRQFLATRTDGGKFQDRLREALKKKKDG
ncbi:MAG: hypothetical protein ACM35H_02085 [Bacteroidota bacterium]|nr:hypothetical protein [Kiloniellaceae bacterium]